MLIGQPGVTSANWMTVEWKFVVSKGTESDYELLYPDKPKDKSAIVAIKFEVLAQVSGDKTLEVCVLYVMRGASMSK